MKHFRRFYAGALCALTLTGAIAAAPVSTAVADSSGTDAAGGAARDVASIVQDNNIPTVYLTIDEGA